MPLPRKTLKFNVAGPCNPDEHYMLPPLGRIPGLLQLVEEGNYFVLHAPRQSGKTTAIQALVDILNEKGDMCALYFSVESVQAFADPAIGMPRIVRRILSDLARHPLFSGLAKELLAAPTLPEFRDLLIDMAQTCPKPLALFFDEVDALSDGTLITFLRELRDGYVTRRMIPFPASVALVSMRNIRDYKARIRPDAQTMGSASPFNIITEALTLSSFSEEDIRTLYGQHTAATGQAFTDEAVSTAYALTRGQPWLVNALARECVEKIHTRRYAEPVTAGDMESAKESIIRARGTHVDSLMERLKEERVRRVVEPVILGDAAGASRNDDDYRYVLDLGILREDGANLVPANPMYAEIILRYLTVDQQAAFGRTYPTPFWLLPDGSLAMPKLMAEFQKFWRENSESDRAIYEYKEAFPHLVLMAYLQRVVNGGGRILREMALGSLRLDLCVIFGEFRYAVELKMKRNYREPQSLDQFAAYLDRLGLAEGWMPVFDEDKTRPWADKLFLRDLVHGGKTIHIVGL